jgi:hypothetical protein
MAFLGLPELLIEYTAAQAYSVALIDGLEAEQVSWRPDDSSSAIGWHLGHQGVVNHFMVRNLTAAEPSLNVAFDAVFDSATPEPGRGSLPPMDEIVDYRQTIAERTQATVRRIDRGDVGAPEQLRLIATGMLTAIINHEYQHAKWIDEVRSTMTDSAAPTPQTSRLTVVDGYYVADVAE